MNPRTRAQALVKALPPTDDIASRVEAWTHASEALAREFNADGLRRAGRPKGRRWSADALLQDAANRATRRLRPGQERVTASQSLDGAGEARVERVYIEHPAWVVTARLRVSPARRTLDLASLTVEPIDDDWPPGGISSTLLERIKVTELRAHLLTKVSGRVPGLDVTMRDLIEAIENLRLNAAVIGRPKTGRRRGPASVEDRQIRAVAVALEYEGKPAPNVAAANDRRLIRDGYDTAAKVRDLKQAAARKGWLARPGQGRRGGYTLTPQGRARLEEANR